jgi:hypothetical protein
VGKFLPEWWPAGLIEIGWGFCTVPDSGEQTDRRLRSLSHLRAETVAKFELAPLFCLLTLFLMKPLSSFRVGGKFLAAFLLWWPSQLPAGDLNHVNLLGEGDVLDNRRTQALVQRGLGWTWEAQGDPAGLSALRYERADGDSYQLFSTPSIPVISGKTYGFRAKVLSEDDQIPANAGVVLARLNEEKFSPGGDDKYAGILATITAKGELIPDEWVVLEGEFIPKQDSWAKLIFTLPKGVVGSIQFADPAIWEIDE